MPTSDATAAASGMPDAAHAYRERGLASTAFSRMFRIAMFAPWFLTATRWFWMWLGRRIAPHLAAGAKRNARRLLGPDATDRACTDLAWQTVSRFYAFVVETGRATRMSREQLVARIERIEGAEHYDAARASGRGAILVTAHLGAFEVGAAAMLEREATVNIVYFRDPRDTFEAVRATTRDRLGLVAHAVNDGWPVWVALRDALARDEAVLVQGDRVMPGQPGARMPFLGGHMLMPLGPAKLALLSGSPLIPVFAIPVKDGKVRIHIEPAIEVTREQGRVGASHPAMHALADVIARYVKRYPAEWHVLHPAWCEDEAERDSTTDMAREHDNVEQMEHAAS